MSIGVKGEFIMIGERLRKLREDKKYQQKEVAEKLGMSHSRYSNYENGVSKPDYDTLLKIADLYDVSVDFLLGRYKTLDKKEMEVKEALEFYNALKDPDDGFFVEGYLKATDEEKKQIRQLYWKIKRGFE